MSSPADPHSILSRAGNPSGGMRPPKAKIQRYRPGKGPAPSTDDMVDEADENIYPDAISHYTINKDGKSMTASRDTSVASRNTKADDSEAVNRRRRIHRTVIVEEGTNDDEKKSDMVHVERERSRDLSKARRRVVEELVENSDKPNTEIQRVENAPSDGVTEIVSRRRNIKEKAMVKDETEVTEDPFLHQLKAEQEEDEDEDDDEEEEDEDEIGFEQRREPVKMLKPVYVHRDERDAQQEKIVRYCLSSLTHH